MVSGQYLDAAAGGIESASVAGRVDADGDVPSRCEGYEVRVEEPLRVAARAVQERDEGTGGRGRGSVRAVVILSVDDDDGHGVFGSVRGLGREHQAFDDDVSGSALGGKAVIGEEVERDAGASPRERVAKATSDRLGIRVRGRHGRRARRRGRRRNGRRAGSRTRRRATIERDVRRARGRGHVTDARAGTTRPRARDVGF